MIKRNDLAKQFELIVQQEIKNYQDSLNFVLQSIRDLKKSIDEVRDDNLENHALLHSVQNGLEMQMQQLKVSFDTLEGRFSQFFTDQRFFNESLSVELREMMDESLISDFLVKEVSTKIGNLSESVSKLKDEAEKNNRILNDQLDDLLRRCRNEIQKVKVEILEAPNPLSLVKKELEEKISSHQIDVSGIMRELNIFKADNVITQKKIENIYTLIQRLQGAK